MIHNRFFGTLDIVHIGTCLYEGWERDWNVLGKTDEENVEFTRIQGRLFEVKLYSESFGAPKYVVAPGKSLEDALDRARFTAIFQYAVKALESNGWRRPEKN